jgi:hypothetical protein
MIKDFRVDRRKALVLQAHCQHYQQYFPSPCSFIPKNKNISGKGKEPDIFRNGIIRLFGKWRLKEVARLMQKYIFANALFHKRDDL